MLKPFIHSPSLTFAGVTIDAIRAGATVATWVRSTFVVVDLAVGTPRAQGTIALVFADQIATFSLVLTRIFRAFVNILEA